MNDQPAQKQIVYASFMTRVLASLVDTILSFFVLYPTFAPVMRYFYAGQKPDDIFAPIVKDAAMHNRTPIESMQFFLTDPRFQSLLIDGGLLYKLAVLYVIQIIFIGALLLLFWHLKGATPGKMLLNIKIVDQHTFEYPTSQQCIIRFLGYFVSFFGVLLGFFWIAIDPKKQGWHDKMAKTVVIKK